MLQDPQLMSKFLLSPDYITFDYANPNLHDPRKRGDEAVPLPILPIPESSATTNEELIPTIIPLEDSTTAKSNITPTIYDDTSLLSALWTYQLASRLDNADNHTAPQLFRQPLSLSRLVKTVTDGVDPKFRKVYFEPFSKRKKPVTLVAIKRMTSKTNDSYNFMD
ncbi:uncharacterized protein LOC126370626 [Pectinophora gossypiella]|uniref:uncharacterized protein LOC126370626 n=1 Tax=Pectinophora gossypiella TaxID=13191 RepID=UPI00214E9AF7|nr:uncharacterized protein LOC126370626 [Pectinophora gossypiella]